MPIRFSGYGGGRRERGGRGEAAGIAKIGYGINATKVSKPSIVCTITIYYIN